MKKFIVFILILFPLRAFAALPVVDYASIAQLIKQIEQAREMISTLQNQYRMLKNYAKLDHDGLAGRKFAEFLSGYRNQFDSILREIDGYQNMFSQISRLDQVYLPFHDTWQEEDDPVLKAVKKEILWTRIQMKHAAKVGAKIRETIPESQTQLESLLNDTNQAQGMLLNAQIGNQIMGEVGKGLGTLNLQMNEFLQAYSSKSLEENEARGLTIRRLDDATEGLGDYQGSEPAPRNPIQVMQ